MKKYSTLWGKNSNSEDIYIYVLENDFIKLEILNIGAIIKKIEIKNTKKRETTNVVIGYNTIEEYEKNPAYIGAVIGRTAGRIKDGIINLPNSKINISQNDGKNNLHGGFNSISHRIWNVIIKNDRISCSISSPHLDNNFPGNVNFNLDYILKDNTLTLEYSAETDRETYINMTNHSYFNLSGGKDLIYEDTLKINSDYMLKIDKDYIPVDLFEVKDTIFDFKNSKKIKDFFSGEHEQKKIANNGIDHSYIFGKNAKYIELLNNKSGIKMKIETDNNAVVVYTSNYFEDIGLKKHSGICFETQEAPNLFKSEKLNIYPNFIDKNNNYKKYTRFVFNIL